MSNRSRSRSSSNRPTNSLGAVVWCYFNVRNRSRKKPIKCVFEPAISNNIEANYTSYVTSPNHNSRFPVTSIKSSKWIDYEIVFPTLTVENKNAVDVQRVCREVCAPKSVFSQGHEWIVKGDGSKQWITYDFDSAHLIEGADSTRNGKSCSLDLSKSPSGLPYTIDFKRSTCSQTNLHTGKSRKVERRHLSTPYVTVPLPSPSSRGSLANGAPFNIHPSLSGPSSAVSMPAELEPVTESLPRKSSIKIIRDKKVKDKKNPLNIEKYVTAVTDANELEADCIICMENLTEESGFGEGGDQAKEVIKLVTCEHVFHKLCLLAMYENDHKEDCLECPSCKTIYGEKCGNCPPGEMLWKIEKSYSVLGYEGYNVIRLTYDIPPGVQGPSDPNPGSRYRASGFPREGFLPDCNKGRKVLKLLIEAFQRKLMFTIGTSITTGQTDSVTWNEIHLKTEATGNYSGHGYPDPFYLDNVLMELASHGVRDQDHAASM